MSDIYIVQLLKSFTKSNRRTENRKKKQVNAKVHYVLIYNDTWIKQLRFKIYWYVHRTFEVSTSSFQIKKKNNGTTLFQMIISLYLYHSLPALNFYQYQSLQKSDGRWFMHVKYPLNTFKWLIQNRYITHK